MSTFNMSEDDEIIAVNDFLVFLGTKLLLNHRRLEAFHPVQELRRKVHQTFGKFFSVGIEATHRIASFEWSDDLTNTGCKEAFPSLSEGIDGPLVQVNPATRAKCERDPMFSAVQASFLG